MFDATRYYPDYAGWSLEATLWHEGDDIDPDEQEFTDAFDALCNLPERELETYAGVALEADAETMEV